jgi:hypothetical protein
VNVNTEIASATAAMTKKILDNGANTYGSSFHFLGPPAPTDFNLFKNPLFPRETPILRL